MKHRVTIPLIISILTLNSSLCDEFKFSKEPKISKEEKKSLEVANKFINSKDNKSFFTPDGSVAFVFGASLPSILTAPLRVTDIRLQEGEIIKELQMGDTIRWQVSPSLSGTAPNEISHIVVKPIDAGLETTLLIFTNKRSYYLNLKSTKSSYFPIVSFIYNDYSKSAWSEYKSKTEHYNQPSQSLDTLPLSNDETHQELDFDYKIEGKTSWRPLNVYNDGKKTYIQMPKSMLNKEAPVLLVLDEYGDDKLVNYRILKDKFIVDKIFHKAVLLLGVGSKQEKITVTKIEDN